MFVTSVSGIYYEKVISLIVKQMKDYKLFRGPVPRQQLGRISDIDMFAAC